MIVQRFICDVCSKDINTEHINRICMEKADKTKLDDLGEYDDDFIDAHFCDDCIQKIKSFIKNGATDLCGLPFNAPIQKIEVEEANAEVVQETTPSGRKKRLKGEELEQAKQRARELHNLGNSTSDIAKELGLRYATVARWL